jgi:tripartite ATP-independent transporter DctM subunit
MITLVLFGVFFLLIILNMPIAFALIGGSMAAMMLLDHGLLPAAQKIIVSADSFSLLAIPFFIAAGELMNRGGITSRLVDLASALVGHIQGSLAQVNVVASMFFAGVSGSAVADTAAVGAALAPPMLKKGYDRGFTAAVTAASGTIGMIIPPSIAMVILGITANVSIGELFLAGIIPGVVIGIVQCLHCYAYARRRNFPVESQFSLRHVGRAAARAVLPGLTPIIIVAGIVGGVFTATEAGATAVAYALVLGIFVYKKLRFTDIVDIFIDTAVITGLVIFLVLAAFSFAWVITMQRVPDAIAMDLLGRTNNPYMMLLMMNVVILAVGCFLDPTPAILILVPILLPIATQFGIDPVHFGIIFVINMSIALLTPPVGVVLYTTCGICNISVTRAIPPLLPFIAFFVVLLIIFSLLPSVTLFLPELIMRG